MIGKKWLCAGTLCSLISVLVACGDDAGSGKGASSKPPGDRSNADAAAEAKKVAETPTELTFAYPGVSLDLFNSRFGDQIRQKFPNYRINYLSGDYANIVATTPSIDIVIASASAMPVNVFGYKLESNIGDLIKKYNYDLSKQKQEPIDALQTFGNGAITGLPWTIANLVLLYNKDLFDKFGVPYPKNGITWDELYDLAKRMTRTDGGIQYRGLTMNFNQVVGWNQLSAPYYDTKTYKAMFMENGFKRVFENAGRILSVTGNEPRDSQGQWLNTRNLFLQDQTTAMLLDNSGVIELAAKTKINWDIGSFPVFADQPGVGPSVNADYVFITSKSRNRDAAFQVLSYLSSEDYQAWAASTYAFLPTLKNADQIMKQFGQSIPGISSKNIQAILPKSFAAMQVITPYTSIASLEMEQAAKDFVGGKDANTVLREAAERVDRKVASAQGK
jgi:multiple sugar transport system substrate-binding protein